MSRPFFIFTETSRQFQTTVEQRRWFDIPKAFTVPAFSFLQI